MRALNSYSGSRYAVLDTRPAVAELKSEPTVQSSMQVDASGSETILPQCCRIASLEAANHLNIERSDLLAQRIAVEPQKFGRLDLIATRGGKADIDQRPLDLPQDPVIKPVRRQSIGMGRRNRCPDAARRPR